MRLLPDDLDTGPGPYLWLIYMLFYVSMLFKPGLALAWIAVQILVLLIFLALYFRGFWLKNERLWPILIGITFLGLIMTPVNPGASAFFIYAAAFLSEMQPLKKAYSVLAGITLLAAGEALWLQWPLWLWIPGVVLPSVVGLPNIHFAERRRLNRKLLRAQAEVEDLAKIAERERIGRDLHDLLGHTLSVIVLKAELARKLVAGQPDRAQREMAEVETVARKALAEVRQTVRGYVQLDLPGTLAQIVQAAAAADLLIQVKGETAALPAQVERAAALIIKEAVTNVMRHANARHCTVTLHQTTHDLKLEVFDDGDGMQTDSADGHGLRGMRIRAAAVGGRLDVVMTGGTRITAVFPLDSLSGEGP